MINKIISLDINRVYIIIIFKCNYNMTFNVFIVFIAIKACVYTNTVLLGSSYKIHALINTMSALF